MFAAQAQTYERAHYEEVGGHRNGTFPRTALDVAIKKRQCDNRERHERGNYEHTNH